MKIELTQEEINRLLWILDDSEEHWIHASELFMTIQKQVMENEKREG